MKKSLAVLCTLPLLSGLALAATPSPDAKALAVLKQDGVLCYSAIITVNDKTDDALSKQAEAIMLKTFNGLYLKATQYDAADTCDRELIYTFEVDAAGPPTIYTDDLKLHTYVAVDGETSLPSATIWSDGYWGGNAAVWKPATYIKKMQDHLVTMMGQFATDYRSLNK
ncbi:hypothetical protein [Deinococcus ruber]|uniref:Uncharacterized protein n=1 Tax=Deinococcus ruber TaxID=1848197 RepID=A0A918C3T0_9DEIO|nr:hypothetical protein [Deinococcus ruber]GGR04471.1 hypothetical protein GCM10008957_16650 [Deinococcus ruber]